MRSAYLSNSIKFASAFLQANTAWKRFNDVAYKNGRETILIIVDFKWFRCQKFEKVYYDSGFLKLPEHERKLFTERVEMMGLELIEITEKVQG